MYRDQFPKKKIGYLSPRTVIENHPYDIYRLVPPGVMLVMVACGLEEFSTGEVERIFKPLDCLLDRLVERNVDIVLQIGVPLPLLVGLEGHDRLMRHIADYTGRPAVSQVQSMIAALRHLGLKNVLLVDKWTASMNATFEAFLDREGISVAGVYSEPLSPREFSRLSTDDSADLAYALAGRALREHPEADGMFIGGGAWLSQPVSEQLETEHGRPVICNVGATVWDMLHRLDLWRPIPGRGRLLSGD